MKTLLTLFLAVVFTVSARAQVYENTYTLVSGDHSFWKVLPNSPSGYVLIGNKFFEPGNTDIVIQGFNEVGAPLWSRTHATGQTLQTMWKSYTVSPWPVRFFAVAATSSGTNAYAILLNATGQKHWDRLSAIPSGTQFGGVTNASNGGWIATGSSGSGNLIVAKFDIYGVLEWLNQLPVSGFGWSVIRANGGGYYIGSTSATVTKVDHLGNYVWDTSVNLPVSPDGSAYTYTEFEELIEIPNGLGVILTGSAFSNSTSAAYTARITHGGSAVWSRIHRPQNTALPGTPVSWINNAIISGSQAITSWRTGPVSTGGTIYYQRMDYTSGALIGAETSMGNTIPLQEGFWTNAHGKYVVGGTRGSYTAAMSFIRDFLPSFSGDNDDRGEPLAEAGFLDRRIQTNKYNSQPIFEYPASRVFASELRVFPNPSTGLVNVGGKLEPGALLRVVSLSGAVVLEQQIQADDQLLQLDLGSFQKGMYTVQVIGQTGVTAQKVIVE